MWLMALWANPLARKVIIYGAVILAILYGLRLWGNKQWSKGETQGRQTMAREMEKAKQAEWKAKEDAIATAASDIATEKRSIKVATDQLAQDRITIARGLKDGLASIQARKEANYANVAAVASTDLDSALRTISAELAASH